MSCAKARCNLWWVFFQEKVNLIKDKYGTYDVARNFDYRDSDSFTLKNCSNTRHCQTPRAHRPQNKRTIFSVTYIWRNWNLLSLFACSYKLRSSAGPHLPDPQCVLISPNNFRKNVTESTKSCYEYHITMRDINVMCYPAHSKECCGRIQRRCNRSWCDWTLRDWNKKRYWF